jgi:uncharacterized metal-binding protein YceD (DUF177 family)
MRCDCCNERLSNHEAVLKHKIHGTFLNTCLSCLADLNIPYNKMFTPDFDDDDGYEAIARDTEYLDMPHIGEFDE